MRHLLYLGGQEIVILLTVISVILFFVVRSIKRNAAMKAENQILKKNRLQCSARTRQIEAIRYSF